MIRYYKLFDLLNRKEIKKSELLKVISAPTLSKLQKGEVVKTDTIDKICLFLKCQPGDIMEAYRINEYQTPDGKTFKVREYVISDEQWEKQIDEMAEMDARQRIEEKMRRKYEKE